MHDAVLRKRKDRLMMPLAKGTLAPIHPNFISFVALVVGLLSVVMILYQQLWIGLAFWILNRWLDGLDGLVARANHKQSDFGAYLDLLLDYVIYLAVPLAFVWISPSSTTFWAGLALFSAYILNLLSWTTLSALLERRRLGSGDRLTSIEMPTGIVEGAETILVYSLFFLLPDRIGVLYAIFAVLVLVTAGQRVMWSYRHLGQ